MAIIGLNYKKIIAEKSGSVKDNMKINTGPEISDVRKTKLQGFESEMDVLSVDFRFKSTVEPQIALINIEGTIIYKSDNPQEILKSWTANKTLPQGAHVEIVNYLFKKVGILALELSDTLQLPPVISMPKIEIAKPASDAKKIPEEKKTAKKDAKTAKQ